MTINDSKGPFVRIEEKNALRVIYFEKMDRAQSMLVENVIGEIIIQGI